MSDDGRGADKIAGEMDFTLRPSRVDLWLSYVDELGGDADRTAYRRLLTPEEVTREARFHFPHDRDLYLVTRALTRVVLGRYCDAAPLDLTFEPGPYGRPALTSQGSRSPLVFNLSHTRGLVVLAVGCDRELGVDVETLQRQNLLDIADRFFAPREVADLMSLPETRRHERFFEYWTLKEAYIKARSMGLQLPLDKFAFQFGREGDLSLEIDPALGDHARRWDLFQFRTEPEFLIALCIERRVGHEVELRIRRTTPKLHSAPTAHIGRFQRSRRPDTACSDPIS